MLNGKLLVGLGVGVAALVGIVAVAHASGGPPSTAGLPAALRAKMQAAIDSGDPLTMQACAAEVKRAGYPDQAQSLLDFANQVAREVSETKPVKLVKVVKAPNRNDPNYPRALAGRVALAFQGATPGNEGPTAQALLKEYQAQETVRRFYQGNIDGLYGPKSALSLANDHRIVPPPPLYYSRKDPKGARDAYVTALLALAAKDPQRREEWQAAAVAAQPK